MKARYLSMLIFFLFSTDAHARTVKIGFTPVMPYASADGTQGYLVKGFKEFKEQTGLTVKILMLPKLRSIHMMKSHEIDLFGLFVKGSPILKGKVIELDWEIPEKEALFTMDERVYPAKEIPSLTRLGTLPGLESIMAKIYKIPKENFYTTTIENLLRMLQRKRINGIIFGRTSTFLMIQRMKIKRVHYQVIAEKTSRFTLAVQNSSRGKMIKAKLDPILMAQKFNQIYRNNLKLPKSGWVPTDY